MHIIPEGGKPRRLSTLNHILLMLRNLAAEGNIAAIRAFHNLSTIHGPQESASGGGLLVVPERLTQKEWNKKYRPQAGDSASGPEAGKNKPSP